MKFMWFSSAALAFVLRKMKLVKHGPNAEIVQCHIRGKACNAHTAENDALWRNWISGSVCNVSANKAEQAVAVSPVHTEFYTVALDGFQAECVIIQIHTMHSTIKSHSLCPSVSIENEIVDRLQTDRLHVEYPRQAAHTLTAHTQIRSTHTRDTVMVRSFRHGVFG